MRARIDNELVRAGTLDAEIDEAIVSAIDHYKWRRWWFNEGTASSTTVSGQEYYDPPSLFLSLDELRFNEPSFDRHRLRPATFEQMEEWADVSGASDGRPLYFCEYKSQIRLHPVPDGAYSLLWSGLFDLGAPSADDDTSAWLVEAGPLIRARAKASVQIEVLRDERIEAQQAALAMRGVDCLSLSEQAALSALQAHNVRVTTHGRIQPRDC